MRCKAPIRVQVPGGPSTGLLVPCGKCLLCRISRRQEWAMRMIHELNYHDEAMFLTLTYDDKNLPEDNSLCKRDIQLFLKSIRKAIIPKRIRYYFAGEYGSKSMRPHYHGIIFGLGLEQENQLVVIRNWNKCDWDVKSIREKSFGAVNHDSIRYVAQYIDTKLYGAEAMERFDDRGLTRPFNMCSKGIGRRWAEEHAEEIKKLELTYRGRKTTIPRYYVKRLDIDKEALKKKGEISDIEETQKLTGLSYTDDEFYRIASPREYRNYENAKVAKAVQRHKNVESRGKLKERDVEI